VANCLQHLLQLHHKGASGAVLGLAGGFQGLPLHHGGAVAALACRPDAAGPARSQRFVESYVHGLTSLGVSLRSIGTHGGGE